MPEAHTLSDLQALATAEPVSEVSRPGRSTPSSRSRSGNCLKQQERHRSRAGCAQPGMKDLLRNKAASTG